MTIKNQDMPANPIVELNDTASVSSGETKREKAFWQVYSKMIASVATGGGKTQSYEDLAIYAIEAVSEGFKALERGDGDE